MSRQKPVNLFDKRIVGEILVIIGAVLISKDIEKVANMLWGQLSLGHLFVMGFLLAAIGVIYQMRAEKEE